MQQWNETVSSSCFPIPLFPLNMSNTYGSFCRALSMNRVAASKKHTYGGLLLYFYDILSITPADLLTRDLFFFFYPSLNVSCHGETGGPDNIF